MRKQIKMLEYHPHLLTERIDFFSLSFRNFLTLKPYLSGSWDFKKIEAAQEGTLA